MPPCSMHIQHWPKFSISFFLIPEFLLCTSCPCRTLLPDTSYTWQTKTKDEFLTATIPFRFLVSLNWKPHVNTCTYVRDNGTAIILFSCLWLNTRYSGISFGNIWLGKAVPSKKCVVEVPERKINFMNIISSSSLKQLFYSCLFFMVKFKQSQS